jgi:hypothetical protein
VLKGRVFGLYKGGTDHDYILNCWIPLPSHKFAVKREPIFYPRALVDTGLLVRDGMVKFIEITIL